jgi:hypothetical protein
MTADTGADEPQGPGWWLASDGKYYPPELSPGTQASADASSAPKKKIVKKKAAAPAAGKKPAKKKVVKKKAASPRPSADTAPPVDLTDQRSGPMKFTAKPPASDQIAARRIQAKEQMVLLSEARQEAALRLLANLGVDEEPELVSVGTRSFDARAERTTIAPSPVPATSPDPLPVTSPDPVPVTTPEPPLPAGAEPMAHVAPVEPIAPPVVSTAPPVVPRAPAQAPPADTAAAPAERPTRPATASAPPPVAPPAIPTPASAAAPAPHRPQTGPEPSTPMGTDVPFMEVKGSALGTDIDRIGEKILIFADRVELRDRNHSVRQTIHYHELAQIEVQKKIMGPSLVITSRDGATMTAKALRPELATGAKAMIEKHADRHTRGESVAARAEAAGADTAPAAADSAEGAAAERTESPGSAPVAESAATAAAPAEPPLPVPGAGRTHKSVLVAMLDELHAAGILSAEEVEAKRSLIDLSDRH